MSTHHPDAFWDQDLDQIEDVILKGKKAIHLPIGLDDRVPPQGRVHMDQTVDVDAAVDAFLERHKAKYGPPRPKTLWKKMVHCFVRP